MRDFGIEVHTDIGKTGVVGVVRGEKNASGRSIALRADMDALPIVEENEFAHRSTKPGLMHGCGHDGHTTMLVGAAQYLARTRNFDGTVYLIFQPGEEGYAGAKAMIDDGLFERFPAEEVYAMHNWPRAAGGADRPQFRADDVVGRPHRDHDLRQGRPRGASAPDGRPGSGGGRTSSSRRSRSFRAMWRRSITQS